MIYSFEDPKIIDALFFLILGIMGDFINSNIINNNIIFQIKNNYYFKYIFLFIIIYFTNSHIQNKNIKDTLVNSITLFIMVILLLKNNFKVIILVLILFTIHKLIDQYTKELDKTKNQKKIKELNDINYTILHINILVMVMGFLYTNKNKLKLN